MGYALHWVAVRGRTRGDVLRFLRLRPTGEHEEIPESEFDGIDLPDGWYAVIADDFGADLEQPRVLEGLSRGGEAVYVAVEEHVMFVEASGWRDGRRRWSVTHDSQKGECHLASEGDLPPAFPAIRERRLAEQATDPGCDYVSEIPLDVAKSLTGFRHDEDPPGVEPEPFERLERR